MFVFMVEFSSGEDYRSRKDGQDVGLWVEAGRRSVDIVRGIPCNAAAVDSNTARRVHESESEEGRSWEVREEREVAGVHSTVGGCWMTDSRIKVWMLL